MALPNVGDQDWGPVLNAHITGMEDDIAGRLARSANLSDLTDVATARTSLGLGGAALLEVGVTAGTVAAGDDWRLSTAAALVEVDWAPETEYTEGQIIRSPLGARYRVTADHTSGSTFGQDNLEMLDGPWPGQPISPNSYVYLGTTGTSTSQIAAGSLRAYAWYLPQPTSLSRIFAEVTTVGDGGSKVRLGIYADTGLGSPGELVLDAGTIAGDSATVQELTIDLTLPRGLYWPAAVSQAVTTTAPTVRTVTPAIPINVSTLPSAGESNGGWAHGNSVSGALPDTFIPSGRTSIVTRIGVKAA